MNYSSLLRTLLCVLCLAASSVAQISNGSFLGAVVDPSGGVVAGATVEVQNLGTKVTRSVTTNGSGEYVIADLPAAHYSIR